MLQRLRHLIPRKVFSKPNEILLVIVIYIVLLTWFLGKNFLNEYLAGDWVRFWVPSYYLFISNLKEGIFTLWQPYQYMGVPAALHPGYMIAYPLLWLVLLFNLVFNSPLSFNILGKTLELYLYFHCLIGALGTYFLLRHRLNLSAVASFSGGFIYVFSLFSIANFDPTFIGKMYLPLIIFLLLSWIQKRSMYFFLFWILVNTFLFTLGYPYYQIYFVYAQLLLAIVYGLRPTLSILGGFFLTGLLTSWVLLPQAYYFMQAARIEESASISFHTMFSLIPTFLMNIIIPQNFYYTSLLNWGTIPLLFLITGFAAITKNRFNIWLILIFVTTLVLGLGGYLGIQDLLGIPPFFLDKLRSHGQILVLTFFTGVIIIAYGIEAAMKGIRNERIMTILWTVFTNVIVILLVLPLLKTNYLTENKEVLVTIGRFLVLFLSGLILYYFITKFRSKILIALVLFLTLLECHYYYANTEPHKLGSTYNNFFARNSLIPEIPTKDNLFRYEIWNNQFAYNTSYLGVFASSGYDGIPYAAAYNVARFPAPDRYLVSNVKYIVTTNEQSIPQYKLFSKVIPSEHTQETIFSTAEGYTSFNPASTNTHYIYKTDNYLPRFYVPQKVSSCQDKNCYEEEKPPQIVYTKDSSIQINNPPANKVTIKVESYEPNKIVLNINAPAKTFIASSEVWDRGWSMKINDEDKIIYNVSDGFRGMIVEKGKNVVVMSYLPPFLSIGLMLTLGGLILLVFIVINKKAKKYIL